MLRILGIPVTDGDARHLIATLVVESTPDALTAAAQLSKGIERGLYAVGLTPGERVMLHESGRVSGSFSLGVGGVWQACRWTSRGLLPSSVWWGRTVLKSCR